MKKRRRQFIYEKREEEKPFTQPKDTFLRIAVFIIILAGLIVYFNTFDNDFIWDDDLLVIRNEYIRSFRHIIDIFLTDVHRFGNIRSNFYRPTQTLTYMIDYTFWKLNPHGYHITSALIHILNGALLYITFFSIIYRLRSSQPSKHIARTRYLALATAVLWVVHPIHTQCVSYISGRADLLATTFILLTIYSYITARKKYITFIFFFFALISKETSLITPILLIGYDAICEPQKRYALSNIKPKERYLPFLIMVVVFIILRCTVIKFPGAPFMEPKVDLYSRFLTNVKAIMILLGLLCLPLYLSMTRNIPWEITVFDIKIFTSMVFLFLVIFYAVSQRKKDRLSAFGIMWFFTAYLPTMNIFPINANVSEHWMYIPSMGFFLIISFLFLDRFLLTWNTKINAALVIMLAAFYGYLTIMRNVDWQNEITFYHKTLKDGSNSARVHYNLGNAYGLKDMYDEAEKHYRIALDLIPDYPEALSNLGLLYYRRGEVDEAIPLYERANGLKGDLVENHANLGLAYEKKGRYAEAEREFRRTLELNPNHSSALNGLGVILGYRGEYEKAAELFRKAFRSDPKNIDAKSNLEQLVKLGKVKQ